MDKITLDYSKAVDFIGDKEIADLQGRVSQCHQMLHYGTGVGSDCLGWVDLPNNYDKKEFNRLKVAAEDLSIDDLENNFAYQYAVIRNLLYSKGKTIEIMASYEPNLLYFGEWYKQLFGESEGKDGKGIFPTNLNFTTDLHSMGQFIQDGRKNIFETILCVNKSREEIIIKEDKDDMDGLNYLSGKTLDFINKKAMEATISAHVDGGVPNIIINIPEVTPYYLGYLVYFFEKTCGMSGYLLGVNPFNQPGVEAYKANMFRLLDKPGYIDVAVEELAVTK